MDNIFYEIKDFPNYEINKFGVIKNKITKKTLKNILNTTGYYMVNLYNEGKKKAIYIHRLVGITFLSNPKNLPEINHIDGNKLNNNIENLEWCTRKENSTHSYKLGLQKSKRGKENPKHKSVHQYSLNGVLLKTWGCVMDIERELCFKNGAISNCCLGKSKTSHGFVWKYFLI
jgi:hypothetical protein